MKTLFASVVAVGLTAVAALTTSSMAAPAAMRADEVRFEGAGATFPAPLYTKWVSEYQAKFPNVKIDYRSIGSGGGIKAITEKTVAFGATDAPLSQQEIQSLGGEDKIIQFPTCAGGVVPAFNLPGITELNFTGAIIADIYLGKIGKWNDDKIKAVNKDVKLPDLAITPAWRTDGSGTTFVFTNYLVTQSADFKAGIGAGKQVKFAIGTGGKGNEGVAAVIQQTKGAIGYVEQNYAVANKITFGAVQNKDGKFVKATTETISAAGVAAVETLKGGVLKADIWNQPGEKAYPIAAFTYLVAYKDLSNLASAEHAEALVGFFRWSLDGGQKFATEMQYAPLAPAVAAKSTEAVKMLTFKGAALKANAK